MSPDRVTSVMLCVRLTVVSTVEMFRAQMEKAITFWAFLPREAKASLLKVALKSLPFSLMSARMQQRWERCMTKPLSAHVKHHARGRPLGVSSFVLHEKALPSWHIKPHTV